MKFFSKRAAAGPIDFLAVGLGNPGKGYAHTRHNTGYMALEALAQKAGVTLTRSRFHSLTAQAELEGKRVLLMFPQTYMNLSGTAVAEAAHFYKLPPERILVFSDDVALPLGRVRLRTHGSDGGQKGLRNIAELLGSEEFPRIRIGVGAKPYPEMEMADWVLSRYSADEQETVKRAAETAAEAACLVFAGDVNAAMNRCAR